MIRYSFAVVMVGLLSHSTALAHKMTATCRVVDSELLVEVFYEDDTPAEGAKVQLRQGERVLLTGNADADGKWKTPRLATGDYLLRAEHYGHVALEPFSVLGEGSVSAAEQARVHDSLLLRMVNLGAGLGVIVGLFAGIWAIRRKKK